MNPEQRANVVESLIDLANLAKEVADEAKECGVDWSIVAKLKLDSTRYYFAADKIAKEGR